MLTSLIRSWQLDTKNVAELSKAQHEELKCRQKNESVQVTPSCDFLALSYYVNVMGILVL